MPALDAKASGNEPVRIGLGVIQFRLGRAIGGELGHGVMHHRNGLAHRIGAGGDRAQHDAGAVVGGQLGVDAIGQPALDPHFIHQARGKSAAAQNIIGDIAGQ